MAEMPKRNRSKDNPYHLSYDEERNTYIVEFTDNKNITHKVEISNEVYIALDVFELEDISQIHKYRKHIEHSEVYEESLNKRAINKPISIAEEVESKIMIEKLKDAIKELPDVQKRRIKKYYFDEMTLEEIAREENCSKVAIKYSIDIAIQKISKKIKK